MSDDTKTDDDILEEALEDFHKCIDAERDNRENALDDLEFAKLGKQWHQSDEDKRRTEMRPCMTFNRMPTFIRQVVNDGRQNKPAIKVHPADDEADVQTAEIMNGLIRNIEYSSNAEVAYDTGLDSSASCGFGYWRVDIGYAHDDTFDMDIMIEPIFNQFSVYGDWAAIGADSAEWMRAFLVDSIEKEVFESKYPDAEHVDWSSDEWKTVPSEWLDGEKIVIAEYWRRKEVVSEILQLSDGRVVSREWFDEPMEDLPEGYEPITNGQALMMSGIEVQDQRETRSYKVCQYILNGREVLETNEWAGKYIPIVPVYGEVVNIEGKRYLKSLIRDAKDAQRNFNYWRTTTTELVALAPKTPFVGAVGQFDTDRDKWERANTDTEAFLEYDVVQGAPSPQRQPFAGVPAGALQESLNASDDMKTIVGIFDSSLGARSNETSGTAINARKTQSDLGTFHFIDNQARAIRHTGRILIDLIPHVYSKARIIRVMGEDKTPQNVPINQQVPQQDGSSHVFDLTAGKYDLTVDVGPNFATKREEAAYGMTELMRAVPQSAVIIGPKLAKVQDWPGADDIAKEWEAMSPNANGQNPQIQQMQQQMQQLQQQLQQMGQQLNDKNNQMQLDARKLDIDAYGKETDRLKVTSTAMDPQQIQAMVMQTVQQLLASPDVLPPAQMNQPMNQPAPQPQQPSPTPPGVN